MQNITKPIITVFFAFIAVAMLLTRTNTVMNNWSNDELNYALRIATQDASAVLIDFELGLVDYAIDDPSVMNKLSAIIDGPGFFAVVDCFDTTMNQPYRLFSIGGSELKLKQDTL